LVCCANVVELPAGDVVLFVHFGKRIFNTFLFLSPPHPFTPSLFPGRWAGANQNPTFDLSVFD